MYGDWGEPFFPSSLSVFDLEIDGDLESLEHREVMDKQKQINTKINRII